MLNLSLEKLEDLILSEKDMAAVLGVDVKRLGYLRTEKGLPCVYLSRTTRIYLAEAVYDWLKKLSEV